MRSEVTLRINSVIPDSYEPYFAGWSRGTANANFAFAMGHPGGGPKKISIDSNGTVRETAFWRVTWSDGMLEGGNGRGRSEECWSRGGCEESPIRTSLAD